MLKRETDFDVSIHWLEMPVFRHSCYLNVAEYTLDEMKEKLIN